MAEESPPAIPAELSPEWLTWALGRSGILGGAAVRSFTAETLNAEVARTAHVQRLRLDLDPPAPHPLSVVIKQSTRDPALRSAMAAFNVYERERRFYEELAPRTAARVPRVYYSAQTADDSALILEDLGSARIQRLSDGLSYEDTRRAIGELAKLHAAWWESPDLDKFSFLPLWPDQKLEGFFRWALDRFVQAHSAIIPAEVLALCQRFAGAIGALIQRLSAPPLTLVHGDMRADNLAFDLADQSPIALFDWQAVARGQGVLDVALLLVGCLPPELRRAHERELLALYGQGLEAGGVRGFTPEGAFASYRLAVLFLVSRAVFAGASTAPGDANAKAFIEMIWARQWAALRDLRAEELLSALGG